MEETEVSWWDRQLCRNRFTLWAGSWFTYLWHRHALKVYDALMIRFWPYGRWPEEWRSIMRHK